MSLDHIVRESFRFLDGIESGSLNGADAYQIADDMDPFLLYAIFQYLRAKYPATNPSSQGVLSRMVELSSTYPEIVTKVKKGEGDVLTEWFEDTYSTSEFYADPEGYLRILVEKLEG